MVALNKNQIKEIAEELESGCKAFCHKTTGELIFIIDTRRFPAGDVDEFEEEAKERLEANLDDYFEIEAMDSSDSYRVMMDFADQMPNTTLQNALYRALNKRGPFQEFKFVIDNSGDFRLQWFAFRDQRYIDWVTKQVAANQEE